MTAPYVPKPELEEVNYTSRITFANLLRLILGFLATLLLIVMMCGLFGEYLTLYFGSRIERYAFGLSVVDRLKVKSFPEGAELLKKLLGEEAKNYSVVVRCDDEPNAFAVPGRAIVITSGLLREVTSVQGLAFVLAHEYGHFAHQDHLRGLGFGLGVAMGLGIIGFDEAATWLTDISSQVISRSYSREQEWAADGVAIDIYQRTFGGTAGAAEFFERMANIRADQSLDSILSTHPLTRERIARIQQETSTPHSHPSAPLQINSSEFCK